MGFWSETFGGGNSFSESVANATTRDDDYEYRGGTLYGKDNNPVSKDQFGSDSKYGPLGRADSSNTDAYSYNLNQGNAGTTPLGPNADSSRGGFANGIGAIMRNPVAMGGLGLMSGGIGSALMSGAIAAGRGRNYDQKHPAYVNKGKGDPNFQKKTAAQEFSRNFGRLGKEGRSFTKDQLTQIREDPKARIEGAFFKDGDTSKQFKMNMFGNSYEINPETGNSKLIEDQAAAAGGDNDGIAAVRRSVGTQATAPTNTMPAISTESEFAKQQVLSPPAEWLIENGYADTNPSYDALVKYNTDFRAGIASMARGGDVEFALGGNEKDLLNAMENVVRKDLADDDEFNPGNMSDEDKIVIAQFVQQYGVDAIPRLVERIQDGSIDETRKRFASGENGEVRGNGDGSGVDDMVTAQLKDGDATQDVLLADGEFVLRKDAYEALKDAGVNVDKVNDAGSNAARELNKMMTA